MNLVHLFESVERRQLLSGNILLDAMGLRPAESVQVGQTSYFVADDGTHGKELWKSDGTAGGTEMVADLTHGSSGSEVLKMVAASDGTLVLVTRENYHVVENGRHDYWIGDYKVWSTDGTSAGTQILHTFDEIAQLHEMKAFASGGLVGFIVGDAKPYGDAASQTDSYTIDSWFWVTDGTVGGTLEVQAMLSDITDDGTSYEGGWAGSMAVAGDRMVFFEGDTQIWSSDGTVGGTFELSAAFPGAGAGYTNIDYRSVNEVDGGIVGLGRYGNNVMFFSDGTFEGTREKSTNVHGGTDTTLVHNGTFYFVNVTSEPDGPNIIKNVYVLDPQSAGGAVSVFQTGGDGSDNRIEFSALGDRVLFTNKDGDTGVLQTFSTDGTPEGTIFLGESERVGHTLNTVVIDGTQYAVRLVNQTDLEAGDETYAMFGGRLPENAMTMTGVNHANSHIELHRTDGTVAGTGVVAVLPTPEAQGKQFVYTLSDANGRLAIRTEVSEMDASNGNFNDTRLISDDTMVYDLAELNLGREVATTRLLNGNLKIGGTTEADDVLIFRRKSNPSWLVVQINGEARQFDFRKVSKITADLQGGDDQFEIRESTGGAINQRTQVFAGAGADKIFTGGGRDTIFGGEGGDLIRSRGNADVVNAGAGKDRVSTGAGQDIVNGGDGRDVVASGEGVDVLFGQSAIERVFGQQIDPASAAEDVLIA